MVVKSSYQICNWVISDIPCENKKEYIESYYQCTNLTKQINSSAKFKKFYNSSTEVHNRANIANESQQIFDKQNKTFQLLKEAQKACINNFVKDQITPKTQFWLKLVQVTSLIIFVILYCAVRGNIYIYPENNTDALYIIWAVIGTGIFIWKSLAIYNIFERTTFANALVVEDFLLNC